MFLKIHGTHLSGHKDMSIKQPIIDALEPEYVYFPINVGNATYTNQVQVGDHVLKGQVIQMRDGRFGHPVCSSVSGDVTAIKKMWHSSGKMVEMLEIKNDFTETCAYGPSEVKDFTREEIVKLVQSAGIVGLGGAGFPTFVKYMPQNNADLVIINAAECEPYITADYMQILTVADKLIRGIAYIMKANGATRGVIAIKKTKTKAIEALIKAIGNRSDIEVFLLTDEYPAGWEKYIVEHVTKKTYSALPREVGAVVNNVQTAIAVCEVVEENKPLIEKVITITGEGIKEPRNLKIKIGTKISTLIPKCGGYIDDLEDAYFIAGGPMTGRAILFDDLIATANVGSVIIKPKKIHENNPTCIGCGKCAEHCPAYLTPTAIKTAFVNHNINALASLNASKCVQCGLCSYVCPSRIEMTDFVRQGKEMLMKAQAAKSAK